MRLTIQEFGTIEVAVGYLDTDGTEEFEFGRYPDGEVAIRVTKDGKRGPRYRLSVWKAEVVKQERAR